MVLDKLFLTHAGILGVISLALMAAGDFLGVYWRNEKKLFKRNRRIHGYLSMSAYLLSVAHIGQGLSAFLDLQNKIFGVALVLHWVHISLAIGFLMLFTKVLIDGYRGVMKCRQGHIVLLWNAILIISGYVIRNLAFGEIIYPFL